MNCPHLDDNELWAQIRLTPLIGPMRCVDTGRPEGIHDFEIDMPNGDLAAVEVTSETNGKRRSVEAEIDRRGLNGYTISGSTSWIVSLTDTAKVSSLTSGVLDHIIGLLTQSGRLSARSTTTSRFPRSSNEVVCDYVRRDQDDGRTEDVHTMTTRSRTGEAVTYRWTTKLAAHA